MRRVLSVKSAMRKALVLSFAVHAAIFGVARPLALRAAAAAPSALAPAEDRWTGTTADLPFSGQTGAVYDVAVDPVVPVAPAVPAPLPPAPADPILPTSPSAEAALPSKAPAPRPAPPAASPRPKRRPRPDGAAGEGASSTSAVPAGGGGAGGPWGPEGPGSVRDFGHAFTRAIAPASDSDPAWGAVPLGDAGKLEVEVHIDGIGHITVARPRGAAPPRALVSLVSRTIVLIQASTFTARDTTVILELHASVREAAANGTDDQDAVDTARGTSSFTQASGRHVQVRVKVLRVEPR